MVSNPQPAAGTIRCAIGFWWYAGIEPAWLTPRVFKTLVSTSFTNRA
jgi:hypothetical protein